MIYLIFTAEGLAEAIDDIIADKATLWLNPDVLSEQQYAQFVNAKISINILEEAANPSNEKSVVQAIEHVETATGNTDILVEYI
jgi:NAD(P)-dependent dehydrogenase (short-subunit alcohol dehydrogenase family)